MPTVDLELGEFLGQELGRHDVQVVNDVTIKAIHQEAGGLTVAGEPAVGGTAEFAGSLGTQVVKVFELAVARTGLRDADASAAGLDPVTVGSVEYDHKAYYPGAHQLHLCITGDRTSGRLLGAQLLGDHRAQVAKRIDIPATDLFHHMTVDGLSELDLSYTPPFGSPWDAVQMVAQAWTRHTHGSQPTQAASYETPACPCQALVSVRPLACQEEVLTAPQQHGHDRAGRQHAAASPPASRPAWLTWPRSSLVAYATRRLGRVVSPNENRPSSPMAS
jgi:hypothetical protein